MTSRGRLEYVCDDIIEFFFKSYSISEKEVMSYGLFYILSLLTSYSLILSVGFIFGVSKLAFTVAITISVFRNFSGGVHASSYRNCTILSILIAVFFGLVAKHLVFYVEKILFFVIVIFFLVGALVIYKYAPASVKEKNINNNYRLKIYSYIIYFLINLIVLVFILTDQNLSYVVAGFLGVIWQLFTITPLAYKLFRKEYIRGVTIDES